MTDQPNATTAPSAGPATRLLRHLADRLGATASVSTVYGQPVRNGTVTVVPVARVRLVVGAGGGGGGDGEQTGEGGGGGGAVSVTPVGYLELSEGATRFRRIRTPLSDLVIPAAVLLTAVRRLVVGARRRR